MKEKSPPYAVGDDTETNPFLTRWVSSRKVQRSATWRRVIPLTNLGLPLNDCWVIRNSSHTSKVGITLTLVSLYSITFAAVFQAKNTLERRSSRQWVFFVDDDRSVFLTLFNERPQKYGFVSTRLLSAEQSRAPGGHTVARAARAQPTSKLL